jgi:replicative DNA helicase
MDTQDVANILRSADRTGSDKDEPEGSRVIQISHTLAVQMADDLSAATARLAALEAERDTLREQVRRLREVTQDAYDFIDDRYENSGDVGAACLYVALDAALSATAPQEADDGS